MLKTISAALLAVSVIAAPALAAETGKATTSAPATTTAPATKAAPETKAAPVIKSEQLPSKVRNANAKMHHKHYRHHRPHKHMGMLKVKAPKHATKHVRAKVATKHVAPAKRG
ncbi:His-rich protein BRANT [Bradyrhizobium sp. USDA 3364]